MFLSKFVFGILLLLPISESGKAPKDPKHPYTFDRPNIAEFGKIAEKDKYYMVAAVIREMPNDNMQLSCGATVLTKTAVLTAASCAFEVVGEGKNETFSRIKDNFFVAGGTLLYNKRRVLGTQFTSGPDFQMSKVKEMIFHKNSTFNRKYMIINVDVMVLKLEKRFRFTDILDISYPYIYRDLSDVYKKLKSPSGESLPLVGYGFEDNNPLKSSGLKLGYVSLKLIEDEICQQALCKTFETVSKYLHNARNYCGIDLHEIGGFCAYNDNYYLYGCFGKRGDPILLYDVYTIGIYSFSPLTPMCEDTIGMGTMDSPSPFIFTRVEKIIEIIEQVKPDEGGPSSTTTSTKTVVPVTRNFGRYAQRTEFPMVASILRKVNNNYIGFCGGSILSVTQVLTSAMCLFKVKDDGFLEPKDYEAYVVLAGSELLMNNPDLISEEVDHWSHHQYWSGNKNLKIINLDILIGTLSNPLKFTRTLHKSYIYIYEPEELDETIKKLQNPNGPTCSMLGWGYDRDYTKDNPVLRVVTVKLMENVYCQRELCKTATPNNPRNFCNFDLDKFGGYCAVSTNRSNKECFGLGGDPLVCMGGYTFGFFSFSPEANKCGGRANLSYPNPLVFTRVEKIKEATQALKIKMYNHSCRFFSVVNLILFTTLFSNFLFS